VSESSEIYRRGGRLVWRFMRTHPGPFAVSLVGAVAFSAAAVGVPLAVGRVTDEVITPAFRGGVSSSEVLGGVAVVVGLGLARGFSIILRRYFAAMVEARMQRTLRTVVAEKYLRVPMAYYHQNPTGELLAHADADVVGTTTSIKPLPFSIGVVALAVFALISLAVVDWTFAVTALVLFPALTLLNRWYTNRVERPVFRSQQLLGEVSGLAHESLDGALVVKTLGLAQAESDRFGLTADELRRTDVEVGRVRASFDPALDALPNLGTLVLFVIGGWRIQQGAVSAGDLVQAALLFSILGFPMRVFGYFLEELPRAVTSIDRIDEVVAAPDATPTTGETALVLPAGPLGVELRDVSFAHGGDPVLDGLSFSVDPGETVAVVGSTGSGKSTMAMLMIRLLDPARGTIRVGGIDIARLDEHELREAVSLVFQESFLFADTLRENVGLGIADDERIAEVAEVARVARFLPEMQHGWDTVVGERGVTLSGGQRQRVALARALARHPRILILDDATSAVDPTIEAEILDGLRRGREATLVVIAHRLSTIRLADRVVYLESGRAAAVGPHDQLAATVPGYQALVRAYEREATT
jgi:ABC-type multidrug transport system fused ATPase/permease subunit